MAKKTAIKTGQPAKFAGGSSDLKDVIPALGKQFGIQDIGAAIAFYKQHQGIIARVLSFFGIGKKKNAPPVAVPVPVPEPSVAAPVPASAPAPAPAQRTPTALKSGLMLLENKKHPRKAGGGRTIAGQKHFEEVKAKTTPARRGDRLHINTTPRDQFGDFMPGGRENFSLLKDPNGDPNHNQNHRIEHVITGGGELTSESDDFGCTPVILIPWEGPDGPYPIDTGERWKVTYQAVYTGDNGERLEGNVVTVLVEE